MYLIIDNANGYIEETNDEKHRDIMKKYEEIWNKMKELVRSINNNLGDFDEKYI